MGEQGLSLFPLYFDRTKECNASLDPRKMAVLFGGECIVLTNATSTTVFLLYFQFLYRPRCVRTPEGFALHTSGNSAG